MFETLEYYDRILEVGSISIYALTSCLRRRAVLSHNTAHIGHISPCENACRQMTLREHMGNEALKRRRDLDVPGALRADSLSRYDASVVVPMWGYKSVRVRACIGEAPIVD